MPRNFLMTWDGKNLRWRKIYKGQRYVVSCRQLDAPETKEDSYRAANAWWEQKRSEIDGSKKRTNMRDPQVFQRAILEERLDWARRNDPPQVDAIAEQIETNNPIHRDTAWKIQNARALGIEFPPNISPENLEMLFGNWEVWGERLQKDVVAPTPGEKTLGLLADEYAAFQMSKVKNNQLSAGRQDNERRHVVIFRDFGGKDLLASKIDEDLVERFFIFVGAKSWSPAYTREVFATTKGFLAYAASKKTISKPQNIDSLKVKVPKKRISTFTIDEVKTLIGTAAGQLKLHLLLMINCGFTQIDVADLKDGEVDWDAGTVTRQRSKTKGQENVPEVCYRLWELTFNLLKKYRSGGPTVLLTAKGGKTWAGRALIDGKVRRWDSIQSNFVVMVKNLAAKGIEIDKPLKVFRKTSATILDKNDAFARYSTLFLGHAPETMAAAHYVDPSQERFDAAVKWLGEQYGF